MNIKHLYISIIYTIFMMGLVPLRKCHAMPAPTQYNYSDVTFTGQPRQELLSNRAIILRGSNHKKITVGNAIRFCTYIY